MAPTRQGSLACEAQQICQIGRTRRILTHPIQQNVPLWAPNLLDLPEPHQPTEYQRRPAMTRCTPCNAALIGFDHKLLE